MTTRLFMEIGMKTKMFAWLRGVFSEFFYCPTCKIGLRLRSAQVVLSILGLIGLSGFAGAVHSSEAKALEVCNIAGFQTTLQQVSSPFVARAYWLNRQLTKWPGTQDFGQFKLYSSTAGKIDAAVGHKVMGADEGCRASRSS